MKPSMKFTMIEEKFISIIEKFISLVSIRLSDDVMDCLLKMRDIEDSFLQKEIYNSYFENLKMAMELNSPCCQDTGMLQFYIKTGTSFPYLHLIEKTLTEAVRRATKSVPLRPNAVDFFEEMSIGESLQDNTGERCPWIHYELIPESKEIEITLYFSGAGCSLPGLARVFKPSDGIEAIIPFVKDVVYGLGVNACPPLLVGIGLGHNIENAAVLSKKALLRIFGTKHPKIKGAELEERITTELNSLGMGAQGLRGKQAVMGVHIESSARHTATIACAVNVSCYAYRRGVILFQKDLSHELLTFKEANL